MDFLEKNLEALKDRCPEVVKWLDEEGHDDRVEKIISKDGHWNLRIRGKKGKSILLYDMKKPLEENDKRFQDIDFTSDKVTFVLGFGLGYSVKYILGNMATGHKVIVLEKNATILRFAFSTCDFSQPIIDYALMFSLTDDESIKNCVACYATGHLQEDLIFATNHELKEVDDELKEIENTLMESVNSVLIGTLTSLRNAKRFVINDLNNFPKFLFSSGINRLIKKFENIPAFIISSGPSLEKNIHHLRRAKGKAVLFATVPAVRVMLAYDIRPDFIVSIDFLKLNYEHFKGICDLEIPLIHPTTLYHEIVKDYQGHGFVYQGSSGITGLLKDHWPFRGLLNAGGSVALHAFTSAFAAGCDPIIFVGQDLSFSKNIYADGVALAQDVDISQDGRRFFWIDGIDGEKVPTNSAFLAFLCRFEEIISRIDNRCINSTEGGAAIKGTDAMALKESIEKYCTLEIPVSSILEESCIVEPVDYEGIIEDIQKKLDEIKRVQTHVVRGLKTNKQIANRMKNKKLDDPKADDLLIQNYIASSEAQDFCEKFELTSAYMRKEMSEINRSKYKYESDKPDKYDEIEIGLKRNRFILKAAEEILKKTKSKLKELLEIVTNINKYHSILREKDDDPSIHHECGNLLAEIGLHRLAVNEYQKCLKGEEKRSVNLDLARSYLVLEKIEVARQELRKYREKGGDKERAAKVQGKIEELAMEWRTLAEEYHQQDNWINALLYARKLERAKLYPEIANEIVSKCIERRDKKIRNIERKKDLDLAEREKEERFKELVTKGKGLMNSRSMNEAIECFKKAIDEVPSSLDGVEARSLLACCYSEKNEMEKAREIFSQLMEEYPETGIFHLNLGRGYLRRGLCEQAIEQYEAAVAKEKRFYFLYFEIGSIYMQNGEYNKAIESFEKYLKYSPDSYELLAKIGTCYLAKGMPRKAKGKYQDALKIQPGYETAQVGLRKIEEMEGRVRLKDRPNGLEERYA